MEERPRPVLEERKPISPKIKRYLDKLPIELRKKIDWYRPFELEQLPDELVIPILSNLGKSKTLQESMNAVNNLRLLSKRFDSLINSIPFIDNLLVYWAEKYKNLRRISQ